MKVLIDTNILVRIANPGDPHCPTSFDALRTLSEDGHELSLVPQVLYEFWVVATRPPANNGLGMSAGEAEADLAKFCSRFEVLQEPEAVFETWRALVTKYSILGKAAHDARLVAAMLRHGVTHLLTFNEQDFARYGEITVITPAAAASAPPSTP